jgi:microcystin-dependent protein
MDAFVGEIRIFAGNFPPIGWAFCNGQLLPIAQNTALFSLLGTQYGGDGRSNFALPNLQARLPIGQGAGPGLTPRQVGDTGGQAATTLTASQIPAHTHSLRAAAASGTGTPSGSVSLAPTGGPAIYRAGGNRVAMDAATVGNSGGGAAHNNMQPYLALSFIIALQGIYPPRS